MASRMFGTAQLLKGQCDKHDSAIGNYGKHGRFSVEAGRRFTDLFTLQYPDGSRPLNDSTFEKHCSIMDLKDQWPWEGKLSASW